MARVVSFGRRWLAKAFKKSWTVWDSLGTALGSLCPLIGHYLPRLESIMNHLVWQIPLGAFCGLVLVRLICAPYWLYKEREEEIGYERREIDREHAIQMGGLIEKIETLKQELQIEKGKQKRPKLSVIYTVPTTGLRIKNYSGLSIKNDGHRAFTIEVTAERRADFGLYFDEQPISEIDAAYEWPLRVRAVRWETDTKPIPLGGLPSDQVSILFDKLAAAGEECKIILTLKYRDYEQMDYITQCCLQRGDFDHIYCRLL